MYISTRPCQQSRTGGKSTGPISKRHARSLSFAARRKAIEGAADWVHKEINWWLEHRDTVPILIDPLRQGIRYVPAAISERWPEMQRIPLVSRNRPVCRPPNWRRKQRRCDGRSSAIFCPAGRRDTTKNSGSSARVQETAPSAGSSGYSAAPDRECYDLRGHETTRGGGGHATGRCETEDEQMTQSSFLANLARQRRAENDVVAAIELACGSTRSYERDRPTLCARGRS